MKEITFKVNTALNVDQFIDLLQRSTLGERRPVDDHQCMAGMIENSNLVVSAWQGSTLVGIARAMTDFHYACYLSDLAVCQTLQKQGVGKKLISLVQERLGPHCKLILIAAPAANTYYEKLGFIPNERCWVMSGSN